VQKSPNAEVERFVGVHYCVNYFHFDLIEPFNILNSGHLIVVVRRTHFLLNLSIFTAMKTCL
jgi:hypothetical protein